MNKTGTYFCIRTAFNAPCKGTHHNFSPFARTYISGLRAKKPITRDNCYHHAEVKLSNHNAVASTQSSSLRYLPHDDSFYLPQLSKAKPSEPKAERCDSEFNQSLGGGS